MPPACPGVLHVRCYNQQIARFRCPRLARGYFTFASSAIRSRTPPDAGLQFTSPKGNKIAKSPSSVSVKLFQPYSRDDIAFAYCYHIYLAFKTHKNIPITKIIDLATLNSLVEAKQIRVLELFANQTSFKLLASLRPETSVAAAAGMNKGQISKWINGDKPSKCLSRGYFTCTSGKARQEEIDEYLDRQGDHHNYSSRINPPIFVQTFDVHSEFQYLNHSVTRLRFHLVLSTEYRKGIFSTSEGL